MALCTDIEAPTSGLLREWEQLAVAVSAPPFLYPGWTYAWSRAFGGGRFDVATVRRGSDLLCALPVRCRARLLHSPTNAHTPLFGPVTADAGALEKLLRARLQAAGRRVDFEYLDDEGLLAGHLRDSAQQGWHIVSNQQLQSPFIDTSGAFEQYQMRLSKKRRQKMSRNWRRLADQGQLAVECLDGTERLDALLAESFAVEGSGWKGAEGSSVDSRRDTVDFYTAVARWAAERGWLRLTSMTLDGRMIAFSLGLQCDGVHYLLKKGYDERFRDYGPGVLLFMRQVQTAFDTDIRSIELLGDATEDKVRWADGVRGRSRVIAFPPTLTGRCARGVAAVATGLHTSMMLFGRQHLSPEVASRVRKVARRFKLL